MFHVRRVAINKGMLGRATTANALARPSVAIDANSDSIAVTGLLGRDATASGEILTALGKIELHKERLRGWALARLAVARRKRG